MNTIQSKWNEAEKALLPKDAGAGQRQDIKHAFYGGAMCVLNLIGDISEHNSEDAALKMIEGLHDEIRAYAASLKR